MRTKILLAAFTLLYFSGCREVKKETNPYETAINESRRLLDSLQEAGKIPGIDAVVAINGEIIWSEGFGYADLEQQAKVIPGKTRFRIGSVSKSLTAAAVGRLIDQGKLSLDSSIYTYVPDFPKKKYPITLGQLGGHIAGIRHYRGKEFLSSTYYPTVKEGLSFFANDTLLFEPGTNYSYSSYGFNLISAAVEAGSEEEFLPYMQKEVFDKLGMSSTCPDKNDSIIVNRTSFYQLDSLDRIINAPYVDNSYKWAGGGFVSTTTDLVKFGEAHLQPGFLSAETLRDFTTSQVLQNGDSTGYGFGWFALKDKELKGFGHSGGSVGGITQFRIFPKEHIIIVLLSNSSNTRYGNLPDKIVRMFLVDKNAQ